MLEAAAAAGLSVAPAEPCKSWARLGLSLALPSVQVSYCTCVDGTRVLLATGLGRCMHAPPKEMRMGKWDHAEEHLAAQHLNRASVCPSVSRLRLPCSTAAPSSGSFQPGGTSQPQISTPSWVPWTSRSRTSGTSATLTGRTFGSWPSKPGSSPGVPRTRTKGSRQSTLPFTQPPSSCTPFPCP